MGGACSSSQARVEPAKLKILLLGGANVGKSTIFKQMRLLYKEGFEDKDREWARWCIYENIMETLVDLDAATDDFGVEVLEENEELVDDIKPVLLTYKVADQSQPLRKLKIWSSIERLWNDPGIQAAFQEIQHPTQKDVGEKDRSLSISTGYFLTQLHRIKREDFVPTDDDILHLRRSTNNSDTIDFHMEVLTLIGKPATLHITCTDVGGQAHERTEWPRHAENLDAILYVLSLSEFCTINQNSQNVLETQLDLLRAVKETDCFGNVPIIVLLNKVDLLEAKLKGLMFADCFPDFTGANNVDDVVLYVKEKVIMILLGEPSDENVIEESRKELGNNIITTCATDTELMRTIIERIGQSILQKTLSESKFFY